MPVRWHAGQGKRRALGHSRSSNPGSFPVRRPCRRSAHGCQLSSGRWATPIGPPTRVDPPADTRMRVRGSTRVVARFLRHACSRHAAISRRLGRSPAYDASTRCRHRLRLCALVDSLYLFPPIGSAMTADSTQHVPVLAEEVLAALGPAAGQTIVDGTLGGGGHARLLAEAVGREGRVIALDRDPGAVERVGRAAARAAGRMRARQLRRLAGGARRTLASRRSTASCSTWDCRATNWPTANAGSAFTASGPLDLRFDTTRGEPAWKLLERLERGTFGQRAL